MTIARSTSHGVYSTVSRVPMMRSNSIGKNPMMSVTLPKEIGDDPLASPIGSLQAAGFTCEVTPTTVPENEPAPPVEASHSSGFANVFTRRRQGSVEKKPPMAPPMLRRTTSAPIKNSLLGKMKPMLKRVVSGSKSLSESSDEDDDDEHHGNSRESLLMLMRVPDIQRNAQMPLMMQSQLDY